MCAGAEQDLLVAAARVDAEKGTRAKQRLFVPCRMRSHVHCGAMPAQHVHVSLDRHKDKKTDKQTDRQTQRKREREREREKERERETDRQTDRKTDIIG